MSIGVRKCDFELIDLMDSMGQDAVLKHFSKKVMKPEEFFDNSIVQKIQASGFIEQVNKH